MIRTWALVQVTVTVTVTFHSMDGPFGCGWAQMMYRVFDEESPPTTIKPKQLVGGEKMHIFLVCMVSTG